MNEGRIFLIVVLGLVLIGAAIWLWGIIRKKNTVTTAPKTAAEKTEDVLVAPLSGIVIPLEQVRDDVFSSGVLGSGAAIIPENGELYSPMDGIVSNIPQSNHALAMTTDNGIELLIHVGIDTVNLKGEHFTLHVKEGDRVHTGQLLMTFALDKIKDAGYDPVTPLILTETNGWDFTPVKGEVRAGDVLMLLEKKKGQ